ncbi:MAG: DNA adenine methylase [Myxococcota bacterium]
MRAVELDQQPRVQPKPFLKWAGGKAKLAPEILARFPERFKRYHEPFIGGGAIYFALGPRLATLSDINDDLVNTYITVRDDVEALIDELRKHHASEEHFYAVRALVREELPLIQAAARTVFLNRTCFNGLYRVNRRGQFNVPFGRYANPKICNVDNLRAVSDALRGVDLRVEDALAIGHRARCGDLVYFDPPYDPASATSSFTSYAKGGFGRDEQARLADVFADLAGRGVHVVLSNSDTPFVRDLYAGFRIDQVYVRRPINSRADRRGPVPEVLVSAT